MKKNRYNWSEFCATVAIAQLHIIDVINSINRPEQITGQLMDWIGGTFRNITKKYLSNSDNTDIIWAHTTVATMASTVCLGVLARKEDAIAIAGVPVKEKVRTNE